MGPDALGQRRLTDAVLALEQRQVVRQASPWKKNAVFLVKEHGLFGERPRSFLRMTAVGLATQGMPRPQGHAVVRTSRGFGAHHLSLWCAPNLQTMRTRIHKIQLQAPLMFKKRRKVRIFSGLSKITQALCQMQCFLEAFRPCERGHKGPSARQELIDTALLIQ